MESDGWKWLQQWLMDIKPRYPEFKVEERLVKLQCIRIPFSLWCKKTFERIASMSRYLIDVGCNMNSPDDICNGFVIIITRKMELIDEVIELICGNFKAMVKSI